MASKVLVSLPPVSFLQGKKSSADMVTLHERNKSPAQARKQQSNVTDRIGQLEQNMKFLQEEHQATLVALHREVELLRQKNRDLQFELVFAKESTSILSSPTSSEESASGLTKSKSCPVSLNVRPLHIELLEKDLQDTRTSLQEARKQNKYLTNVIEEQKMKSSQSDGTRTDTDSDTTAETTTTTTTTGTSTSISTNTHTGTSTSKKTSSLLSVAIQVHDSQLGPIQAELELLTKRLRRKTEERHKQITMLKAFSMTPSEPVNPSNSGNPTASISQAREHKNLRGYRNHNREETYRQYRSQTSQRDRLEPAQHCQHPHHHQEQRRRQQQHTCYHRGHPQQRRHRRDYKDRHAKERPKADSGGESDVGTTARSRDDFQH